MLRRSALAALLLAAACSNPPPASGPDASGSTAADASCAYPCGAACCTKNQTCDFATETCTDKCVPDCNGRSCGSDGCDDPCGYCDPGTVCNEGSGKCVLCNKQCTGKQCGSDGCGSTCGTCDNGFVCAEDFLCHATFTDGGVPPAADGSVQPGADTGAVVGEDAGTNPTADSGTNPALDAGVNPAVDAGSPPGPDASTLPGADAAGPGLDASLPRPDASVGPGADGGSTGPYCTPPAPTYNPSFTAAQYCDQWSRVICDRLARCCMLASATYDDCVQYKYKECDTQDVVARIQAGTITVNMAAAKACLDGEKAREVCDGNAYNMLLPACDVDRVFVANAALGAKCYRDSDCKVGGFCKRTPSTCDGVCTAFAADGAACSATALCDARTSQCLGSVCAPKIAVGQPCTTTGGCVQTAYCDATSKLCVARNGLGGACVDGSNCLMELDCVGGFCRESYSTPLGAPCKANSNCVLGSWCKGASSGVNGSCTAYTAPGGACTAGTSVECGPEGYCLSGTCIARLGVGASCSGASCQSGLTCSGSKCVVLGDPGAACTADAQCKRYLRCASNLCTDALAPTGAACSYTPQCDNAYCPGTNVCTALVPDGQTCTSDVSCASGNCETNVTVKACRPKCTY